MLRKLLHSVVLVEFDELKGNTLSYTYPASARPAVESHTAEDLAELCLPDGGHKHESDSVYMLLTGAGDVPLYGLACFRNRKDSKEKRGARQLALLIIARRPYFDRFRPLLTVAVDEILERSESKSVIIALYKALELSYRRGWRLAELRRRCLDSGALGAGRGVAGAEDASDDGGSAASSLVGSQARGRRDSTSSSASRGSAASRGGGSGSCSCSYASHASRASVCNSQSRAGGSRSCDSSSHACDAEAAEEAFVSLGPHVCGSNGTGPVSPQRTATAAAAEQEEEEDAAIEDEEDSPIVEAGKGSIYFGKLSAVRVDENQLLLGSSCTYTMQLLGRVFVMQPLAPLAPGEFGGASLSDLVRRFRVQTMVLWAGLVSLKRILFFCGGGGPEAKAETVGNMVLASPLLVGPLGSLIVPQLVPYVTLADVEQVSKHRSYVCGTTNGIFATKKDWYDVLADPSSGKIALENWDRSTLKVAGADLAFIQRVMDGIEQGKRGEDWVRSEFASFTHEFLDQVRVLEVERSNKRARQVADSAGSGAGSALGPGPDAAVSLWKLTSAAFNKHKAAKAASERIAQTFAGSSLWLRFRWLRLNPKSYGLAGRLESRIHEIHDKPDEKQTKSRSKQQQEEEVGEEQEHHYHHHQQEKEKEWKQPLSTTTEVGPELLCAVSKNGTGAEPHSSPHPEPPRWSFDRASRRRPLLARQSSVMALQQQVAAATAAVAAAPEGGRRQTQMPAAEPRSEQEQEQEQDDDEMPPPPPPRPARFTLCTPQQWLTPLADGKENQKASSNIGQLTYEQLVQSHRARTGEVEPGRVHEYLHPAEFGKVFGMELEAFTKLPQWRRERRRKDAHLF
jgi:hypothetical protein